MWQDAVGSAWQAWSLQIEGLSVYRGLLAFCYLTCSWLCFVSGYAARRNGERSGAWFIATALMAILAVDAVFEPTFFLVQFVRQLAQMQGWYEERRREQLYVLILLAIVGLFVLGWLRTRIADAWSTCGPAVLGLSLLVALAALRAISFHDTDVFINLPIAGFSLGRLLELGGLALVWVGTIRWLTTR